MNNEFHAKLLKAGHFKMAEEYKTERQHMISTIARQYDTIVAQDIKISNLIAEQSALRKKLLDAEGRLKVILRAVSDMPLDTVNQPG